MDETFVFPFSNNQNSNSSKIPRENPYCSLGKKYAKCIIVVKSKSLLSLYQIMNLLSLLLYRFH